MRRLHYWLRRSSREDALREEIDLHLAERTADLEASGLTPAQARAEARRLFGNVGLTHEASREIWMTRFLSELAQDVRYGWRSLVAHRGFSLMAVLSLALGIGANTAIYSFMESILLRSLPVADPDALVVLNWQSRAPQNPDQQWEHVIHGVQGLLWPGNKGYLASGMFPYPAFENLRQDNPAFSTLFGYFNALRRTLTIRGEATTANAEYVTGEYFAGLAVAPAAGRLIASPDDRPGATPVAVLSFALSQQRFGSPAQALGQQVLLDRVPFTVIGVAPPEFFGVDPAVSPDIYLPLHTNLLVDGSSAARMYGDSNFYWLEMMGRLRPGVTLAQAQAALAPRFHAWVANTATTEGERNKLPALQLNSGAGGLGSLRRQYSKPIFVLFAMVGLILAITCANIANLLLARAAARRREMAVRLSLGAGRFRVIRQLLTESVMLATVGGAVGVLFAIWGVRSLTLLFSRGQEDFTLRAELNWPVLAVTAALSLLCGLFFGLVPALQATRPDVLPALKDGHTGGPGGSSRRRVQHVLLTAQIAMSFLILVAAGLFVQTLNQLHSVQLGYARENILLFSVNARQSGHRDPEINTFYADLRRRFAALPGISGATLSHASIIHSSHAGVTYRGEIKIGTVPVKGARVLGAGPGFLTTMQIPLLAGREIDERDRAGSAPVAVISERLARQYFGPANPLGRRLTFVGEKRDLEIVGVSANLRHGSLKEDNALTVFAPLSQMSPERITYALRTTGDPLSYVSRIREIVRDADAALPVTDVLTQATEIDRTINREITFAKLCTGFALLALLTACVGLYGTLSYHVTRQIGEIGLRMALGAPRTAVVWMVLRHVLLLVGVGLAISLPAALGSSKLVKSFLYGTQPNDPATLALAALVLLTATLLAAYGPARRASRIDPLLALRRE